MVLGVFAGSTLWWLILSGTAGAVKTKLSPKALHRLNLGSGVMLVFFGIIIIASLGLNLP